MQHARQLRDDSSKILILFDWPCLKSPFLSLHKRVRHVGSQNFVPYNKEGLGEVVFVTIELVVDVMISAVVIKKHVEQVPWKP